MTTEHKMLAAWIGAASIAACLAFLTDGGSTAINSAILAATLIAIFWYTFETRGLRLEQQRSRDREQVEEELRAHPWLRATDLKADLYEADHETPLQQMAYLPITNQGTTPALDLQVRTTWSISEEPQPLQGQTMHGGIVLVPGDTAHVKVCEMDVPPADAQVDLLTEITYRTLQGGAGRLRVGFKGRFGYGFSNTPADYEVTLRDQRVLPAREGMGTAPPSHRAFDV